MRRNLIRTQRVHNGLKKGGFCRFGRASPRNPNRGFKKKIFCRKGNGSGGRKEEKLFSCLLVHGETGMIPRQFQIETASMNDHSGRQAQQMEPKRFEPGSPPNRGQTLPFHHRKDVVSQNIQPKPSGIGEEPLTRHTAHRQYSSRHRSLSPRFHTVPAATAKASPHPNSTYW